MINNADLISKYDATKQEFKEATLRFLKIDKKLNDKFDRNLLVEWSKAFHAKEDAEMAMFVAYEDAYPRPALEVTEDKVIVRRLERGVMMEAHKIITERWAIGQKFTIHLQGMAYLIHKRENAE
jgi:hypothetical protein